MSNTVGFIFFFATSLFGYCNIFPWNKLKKFILSKNRERKKYIKEKFIESYLHLV